MRRGDEFDTTTQIRHEIETDIYHYCMPCAGSLVDGGNKRRLLSMIMTRPP